MPWVPHPLGLGPRRSLQGPAEARWDPVLSSFLLLAQNGLLCLMCLMTAGPEGDTDSLGWTGTRRLEKPPRWHRHSGPALSWETEHAVEEEATAQAREATKQLHSEQA